MFPKVEIEILLNPVPFQETPCGSDVFDVYLVSTSMIREQNPL